jgi:hypothetical protein
MKSIVSSKIRIINISPIYIDVTDSHDKTRMFLYHSSNVKYRIYKSDGFFNECEYETHKQSIKKIKEEIIKITNDRL